MKKHLLPLLLLQLIVLGNYSVKAQTNCYADNNLVLLKNTNTLDGTTGKAGTGGNTYSINVTGRAFADGGKFIDDNGKYYGYSSVGYIANEQSVLRSATNATDANPARATYTFTKPVMNMVVKVEHLNELGPNNLPERIKVTGYFKGVVVASTDVRGARVKAKDTNGWYETTFTPTAADNTPDPIKDAVTFSFTKTATPYIDKIVIEENASQRDQVNGVIISFPAGCDLDAPVLMDDVNATLVNTNLSGDLSANDTQTPKSTYGGPVANIHNPSDCVPVIRAGGVYTFNCATPGKYIFTIPVCQPAPLSDCDNEKLTITVNNTAATDDVATTPWNTPVSGNVKTNDRDPQGDVQTVTAKTTTIAGKGTLVVKADGSYTFTPVTTFSNETVTFPYTTCDDGTPSACITANLAITVGAKPTHVADNGAALINTTLTGDVSTNDVSTVGTKYGTPVASGTNPSSCVPAMNTNGSYTFLCATAGTYNFNVPVCEPSPSTICENVALSITVNNTLAVDDNVTTPWNTAVSGNVKTNDNDPQGNTQTVTAQTTTIAGKGTLVLKTDGTYIFTPLSSFTGGSIDFPYTICDNGTPTACATATLHILVKAKPSHGPDFGVTIPNIPLDGNLKTNDPNPTPGTTYGNPPPNTNNPSSCTPTVNANGTYTFVCGTPGVYIFYVPTCEPAPSTSCENVPLQITIKDPNNPTANPIANPDYTTTKKNTPVTINVAANDKCQNGATCTLGTPTVSTTPQHGTYNAATGIYTPTTGYVGVDSFKYTICDNQAMPKCSSTWAYINVTDTTASNNPNTTNAMDDYAQTPNNTAVNGNVKNNDTDVEGNTQTVAAQTTTMPAKGTLVLKSDGTYTFTPAANFTVGNVDFPYTTCDNGTPSTCATATLHILVGQKPIHNPDFGVTDPKVPLDGNLKTNDPNPTPGTTYSNPPANPGNPSDCSPTVKADGTYTFICVTPGVYIFYVPVCEPAPSTSCENVPLQITVKDPNNPATNNPVANNDYAATKIGTPVTINVTANDKCQNGAGCTLSTPTVTTAPTHGTYNPSTGMYTPTTGFVGKDSLKYTVCDNQPTPKCTMAWAYINVTDTTVSNNPNTTNAMDDYAQTLFNTAVTGNAKTNDTDVEGNTQTVSAQTTTVANKGTLLLKADGSYTFTPVNGFSGPVDFAYTTCDNGVPSVCATATLHVLVAPYAPKYDPDFGVTYPNVPLNGNVSTNDGTPGIYSNPAPNSSNPSSCTPTIASDGTYTFTCATPGIYVFQVPTCEAAPGTACTTVPLIITVLDPNNPAAGPIANPDNGVTKISTPVIIDVRSNDKCQNGAGCTLNTPTTVTPPKNGIFDPSTGTYTPNTGFTGKDSVQYQVCDNQTPIAKCATAWVYIDVLPTAAPNSTQAADDYAQTPSNTPVSGNVKTNDTDPEGNTQSVTAQTTTVTGKGTLILKVDGSYTFTPVGGFTGPVDFTYTTCDNGMPVACASATLHILVQPSFPDLTPSNSIDQLNFIKGAERDFTVNLFEILNVDALSSNKTIQFVITKLNAFDITVPGITLTSIDQSGISGTSNVGGGRPNQNGNWLFRETGSFIIVTAKTGVNISASSFASIGFHIKLKTGVPLNTSQNLTATVIPGSGGEINTSNNVAISIISTN